MKIIYPESAHLRQLKALWKTAFGDEDRWIDYFFSAGYCPRRCRIVLENDAPVAMAFWFPCQYDNRPAAYLYGVATDPAWRNRGLCRALLQDIHALLSAQGCAGCVLVPGSPSLGRMYASMGYAYFGGMDTLRVHAREGGLSLRPLDPEAYLRLRRRYLPAGGVVQEDILPFFPGSAGLYAGDGFLLAAEKEGDFLRGIELLGDGFDTGKILSTLGAKEGVFRLPGQAPFAMFLPLSDLPAPTYFGLAFD